MTQYHGNKEDIIAMRRHTDPVEDILKKANEEITEIKKPIKYKVVVHSVNVRKSPNMDSESNIATIKYSGDTVEGTIEEDWLKLTDGNYIKSEFVAPVKED